LPAETLLPEETVAAFQRDGAVCLRRCFDPVWLNRLAAGIERNRRAPSPAGESLRAGTEAGVFFNDYCNWRRIPEFEDFVLHSPAAPMAAQLIRSRQAIFYHEHVLVKEPGAEKRTPWHHDQPYYPIEGWQVCSLWLPLDPVPLESSLQFVRGSHAWGRWFMPRKFETSRDYAVLESDLAGEVPRRYETVPDIDAHPEQYEVLSWAMEPGDCIAFHMLALHGAAGNVSPSTSRRVLATRWLGDDARFAERPWQISPPNTGGLQPGDPMACEEFPVVWEWAE
jgi:ectoine hydroxylase-related dioxygenase (phytanoyl-CoA dioxygenase family)